MIHASELTSEVQLRFLHSKNSLKKLLEETGFQDVNVIDTTFDMSAKTTQDVAKGRIMLAFTAFKK